MMESTDVPTAISLPPDEVRSEYHMYDLTLREPSVKYCLHLSTYVMLSCVRTSLRSAIHGDIANF